MPDPVLDVLLIELPVELLMLAPELSLLLPPPPVVVSPFPLSQANMATAAQPPRKRLRYRKECT
jgi:hypothetical protein